MLLSRLRGAAMIDDVPQQDKFLGNVAVTLSFEMDSWKELKALIQRLKKHHGGKVKLRAEGPDARTVVIAFGTGELVIYQWDTGDVQIRLTSGLGEIVAAIAAHYNVKM